MAEVALPPGDALTIDSYDVTSPAQVNRSAWTGTRKVVGLPGAEQWTASISIGDLATEIGERPWRAFLFGLRGVANWFRLPLPCQPHVGNMPTVRTGAGSGYTLPLAGLAASTTVLTAGQFMTVPLPSGRWRTVCLRQDLVTNGQGQATASFDQALTEIPTAGVTVESKNPFLPMSLAVATAGLSLSQGVAGRSFDLEEAR